MAQEHTGEQSKKAKSRKESRVRAKVEHLFGAIENIFGFGKLRDSGVAKNLYRLEVTAALTNLAREPEWLE